MAKATKATPRSQTTAPAPQAAGESLVVRVAQDIFVKTYMDSSSRTPAYLAEKAFEAAQSFADYAEQHKQ